MSDLFEQSGGGSKRGGGLHGRFDYALDPKRRFTIPAVWREIMGAPEFVYILPDLSLQCLHLLPPEEMKRNFDFLDRRDLYDTELDTVQSFVNEYAETVGLDVQGRIRVSDKLLSHAAIEDTVVMIGNYNRVQLWALKLRPATAGVDQDALAEAYTAFKRCRSRIVSRER